jgi:hypothetical protein
MNTALNKKSNPQAMALIVIFALLAISLGFFLGMTARQMPQIRQGMDAMAGWELLLIPLWFLIVLAIHEAGHLLGGFRRGMRFLLFIVGPCQWSRTQSGIRFNWLFNLSTFGGLAAATPNPDKPLRPQLLSFIAGGPAVSLMLAIVALLLVSNWQGSVGIHVMIIGVISLFTFLATAIPSRIGGYTSDGKQFLEVLNGGEAVMERQRFTTLMAQSMAGIRPRDWDADWLEPATRNLQNDPLRMVATRQMAMLAAQDRGDTVLANTHADWLAEHYQDYPLGFRQGLTIELCLHALTRGNPTAAKMWMGQSKGGMVDKSRRALAEAELALVEGNKPLALGKQIEARSQLKRGMDAGLSKLTVERLDVLMAKLASKPSSTV